jgi:PIN domain nuclease of toxin-antitoxin system
MSTVFDASALISFLRDEPGADEVQRLLEQESAARYVHAINLCEVY